MGYFIVIRGPLGVGKSTISKGLAKGINGEYISIDEILAENGLDKTKNGIPVENFLKANEILIPRVEEIIKSGKPVVIDGNFYYKEVLEDLEKKLKLPHKIFTLKCPVEICVVRDSKREKSYGQGTTEYLHMIVSKFDYGTNIDASKETREEIISDIKDEILEINQASSENSIKMT